MIDDQEKREPEDDDKALARELRARLRASSDMPDAVVRARLSAVRARAIASRVRSPAWNWAAAGAAVAASLVAAVIALQPDAGFPPRQPAAGGDDVVAQSGLLELLTDDDGEGDDPAMEVELYDDLDVLTWLAGGEKNA